MSNIKSINVNGQTYEIDSNSSSELPIIDYNDGDFGIADEQGNILVNFKDGHIKTKNFDSNNIQNSTNASISTNTYKNKKCSILGDSISTFGTPSSTNQNGTYCYSYYPQASCRYSEDGNDSISFNVNDTWWMKVINQLEMNLGINDSYRGTTVTNCRNSNIISSQERINHLGINGTPDVIIIYAGTNDAGSGVSIGTFNTENPSSYTSQQLSSLPVTTFCDAYRTMLIRVMKTYPLAEIIVILPTYTTSYYTITNLDLYEEAIKEICDFFGIKYIDIRTSGISIYNKEKYLVDGIHPNKNGMKLIADKITKQILYT